MAEARTTRRRAGLLGLIGPGALWTLLFFNIPLVIVLFISFVERGRKFRSLVESLESLEGGSRDG